jgi:arsenite methyltransferase
LVTLDDKKHPKAISCDGCERNSGALFMGDQAAEPPSDTWSRWLLHSRHGGDPALRRAIGADLQAFADRVLDGARLGPGMTLVDIGSGEGLVPFRAIERCGPTLRVILTDISVPMLLHAEASAKELGIEGQCSFVACGAETLNSIADLSVDAVTTRAVLAYVADKQAALREFRRVLKPGGRLSIAEPIFQDDAFVACALQARVESQRTGRADPLEPLLHRWKAAQFPDTQEKMAASPITNFSERTLFEWIRLAGFEQVHMELHIDTTPARFSSWQTFLESTPHPWAPALTDILAQQFTAQERQIFESAMRPRVESGQVPTVIRTVYATATS